MIEGDAGRDGIPRRFYSQLWQALVEAMRTDAKMQENHLDGINYLSPDQYTLVLPTEQAQLLLTHPVVLDSLARKLERSAAHLNIQFGAQPMLRVVADPSAQGIQVFCAHTQPGVGDSLTVELESAVGGLDEAEPEWMPNAFLIVNGLYTYRLTEAVTNIGSDPSNQLVLKNPQVARLHAQLRLTAGRLVIFDLDSKAGTFVNGIPVTSHLLNQGDVILIAGVPLIYGEESAHIIGYTQELPAEPPPPEVM
ncbi:MAG TPA: FHA domain-containing protein [Anaerolineales bacterium]